MEHSLEQSTEHAVWHRANIRANAHPDNRSTFVGKVRWNIRREPSMEHSIGTFDRKFFGTCVRTFVRNRGRTCDRTFDRTFGRTLGRAFDRTFGRTFDRSFDRTSTSAGFLRDGCTLALLRGAGSLGVDQRYACSFFKTPPGLSRVSPTDGMPTAMPCRVRSISATASMRLRLPRSVSSRAALFDSSTF